MVRTRSPQAASIAGLSANEVREFLKQAGESESWTTADLAEALGLDPAVARQAALALAMAGYVENAGADTWRNTEQGNDVAEVKRSAGILRRTADAQIQALLERIQNVNQDPKFLYRVAEAVVFGPYLADSERIKDVDVAVALEPKEPDPARHEQRMQDRAVQAETSGKKFSTHAARRFWGLTEVQKFLGGRSHALALNELTDRIRNGRHRRIWPPEHASTGKPPAKKTRSKS